MDKDINNNGFDYVDLGLPSGTLWATMNVGASKPSDFGLYFQWGDTQGYTFDQVGTKKKFAYDWSDYKWYESGIVDVDDIKFKKYTAAGAKLNLDDDAAHTHMGGDWHMPTIKQIKELIDNTTSEWIEQDGVKGKLLTSKNDPSKPIFIPAAGQAWDGLVRGIGYCGIIWTSMLYMDGICGGECLSFGSGYDCFLGYYHYNGFPVRGVIG